MITKTKIIRFNLFIKLSSNFTLSTIKKIRHANTFASERKKKIKFVLGGIAPVTNVEIK
jgi:hypothetical protein